MHKEPDLADENPLTRWIGHEFQIDGIRWKVVEVHNPDSYTCRGAVRYERVDETGRTQPPIPRDPPRMNNLP